MAYFRPFKKCPRNVFNPKRKPLTPMKMMMTFLRDEKGRPVVDCAVCYFQTRAGRCRLGGTK